MSSPIGDFRVTGTSKKKKKKKVVILQNKDYKIGIDSQTAACIYNMLIWHSGQSN